MVAGRIRMSRRLLMLGLLLGPMLAAAPGCRSLQQGSLRGSQGGLAALNPRTATVRDHIARHNELAARVDALKVSDLDVQVKAYQMANGRERQPFFANTGGVLMVQRPKNLKLNLRRSVGGEVADIGSNPQEFWMSNAMDRQMLVGRYDQVEGDPLAAAIQPEWILEILNLQPISPDAAIEKGKTPGTFVLKERRPAGAGQVWTKETLLSETDGRLLEHALYTQDKKLIARASVKKYREVSLPGGDPATATAEKVSVPQSLTLEIPGMVDLALSLNDIEVNPPEKAFPPSVFVRPTKENEGYALVDIREVMAAQGGKQLAVESGGSSVEPPRPSSTVRLSDPGSGRREVASSGNVAPSSIGFGSSQVRSVSSADRQVVGDDLPRPPAVVHRSTWRMSAGGPLPAVSPEN